MDVQKIVEDFIACWNRGDVDAAWAMAADDIVWDNIPMGPAKGIEACKALMAQFPPIEGIEFVTHHIVAKGNIVMTERTDKFLVGGKWRAIRLMGIFEINTDGKVQHWRDYFDMAEFQREFA
jgi:limonene-1,2-epoxide hydrolase